jgi:predicted CopG family antitoxin
MVKRITIKEGVYKDLIKVKKNNESFSDLFERLVKAATPLDVLGRIRGSVEFKAKNKMLSEIRAKRF